MKPNFLRKIISRATLAGALLLPSLSMGAEVPQALTQANPNVKSVIAVQNAVTRNLMAVPDVIGTAVGLDAQGKPALLIFVNVEGKDPGEVARSIPGQIQGVNTVVEMTTPFRAFPASTAVTTAPSHKAIQTPPISLGTSGGWRDDLANGYCCGGTLGSLVQKDGKQYILSNYHVLESDIVTGGNNIISMPGDPVSQPGLIDVNCNANNAQSVATLSGIKSLPGSNVDAALAEVIPGMVRTDGNILEIGVISATTVLPALSQKVKKSGRTTALTRSSVNGLNATVSVSYDNECAGGAAFTKTFTGQVLVNNRIKGKSFLAGGDSGSLLVQDVTTNPKAVGLLYAGSSTIAVANPIDEVLSYFGATMVGQ